MKKLIYIFAALLAFNTLYAQQRLVLVEEATQASCGPCAQANPGLNATLSSAALQGKVVSIKYQTDWPGVDPMNVHNPTQVDTRVAYYGITGVPNTRLDGATVNVSAVTSTAINNRYAVASPFNIVVTHRLNPTFDSIFVTSTITKIAATTGTTLRAHVVVVEKEINFLTAPGSNGEKDFYSVMKRMLPTDQGTTLPVMAVGDVYTINTAWALSNIYDKNQLAVVSFVQDHATKVVQQTGFSAPQGVVADVKMNAVTVANNTVTCANNTNLVVNLKNNGPDALTSCNLRAVVGTTPYDIPWTGNIPSGQSADAIINVPLLTFGGVKVQVTVQAPNTGDFNTINNTASTLVVHANTPTATMPVQGFISGAFPPAGWAADGRSNDAYNWARSTVGTTGSAGSAFLNCYNITAGNEDDLIMPNLDFTAFAAGTPTKLSFSLAHAKYYAVAADSSVTELDDRLNVMVSTDCGATWQNVYSKSSLSGLATSGRMEASFVPTTSQWRSDSIDLSNYNGQSGILIKFNGVSDFGNNVFLDRININNFPAVSTQNLALSTAVSINPNLTKGNISVNISLDTPQAVAVEITNALGQRIVQQHLGTTIGGAYPFDLTNQPAGNYFVRISADGNSTVKKVVKL